MANFAQLDADNKVIWITHIDNEIILDENGIEREELGLQHILKTIPNANQYEWKQFSINGNFRVSPAFIGGTYDENLDRFFPPKPYESWIYDDDVEGWIPPITVPDPDSEQFILGYYYEWDEDLYQSDNTKGFVLKQF